MRRVVAVYLGLGLLLAPVPLLNVLQAESAAVVAFVAFFVAGGAAIQAFERPSRSLLQVLGRQESALLVPLGVLLVAQFWAPNCTVAQGLLFYALFPGVTVIFAVSIAYALQGTSLSHPRLILAGIGVGVAVAGPLYDLGLHPQFYTYNHVFGGVLGPIYDEQLAVRRGLFAFRGLTLLWAGAAVLLGLRLRGRGPKWALPLCALAIGGIYFFSASLGINTPAWYLREQLGGHIRTANFDVYYDAETVDRATAETLAQAHEAQYDWVRRRLSLGTERSGARIESYIYPNPEVKGRLTGARTTSVTPVWLSTPQMHLLRSRVAESLGHELAHVVSRPYGLPGLRASWAPGLIEGWAVALEPPSPVPSPDDLVLTAAVSDTTSSLTGTARAVASRLSPWGFWTGRGAVSYATMGSFVQYLLDRFGAEKLKRVYTWGNFEAVYGRSLQSLAEAWAAHLRRTAWVARDAHALVARRFTRPSLFEEACPHYVPPARRHLQAARAAARRRDTTEMVHHLERALARRPTYAAAHLQRARVRLARGKAAAVRRQLDTLTTRRTVGLRVALADARAMQGASASARALYAEARARTPHYAHGLRARLTLRDAVAARPRVVQILVSGDSAAVQARRLAALAPRTPALQAWRGVRAMAAHDYETALEVWLRVESPVASGRPHAWRRAWTIQHAAWTAKSALRAGTLTTAHRWARRALHRARRIGDRNRGAMFEWWASRARRGPDIVGSFTHEGGTVRGTPLMNHLSREMVGRHRRRPPEGVREVSPAPPLTGSCSS